MRRLIQTFQPVYLPLWWVCLTVLTYLYFFAPPPPGIEAHPNVLDKVFHMIAFAGTTIPGLLAARSRISLLGVIVLMLVVGGGYEWLQGYLPMRESTPLDALANMSGVFIGGIIARVLQPNCFASLQE